MKIKAAKIAKDLGISKATVSLALNDKDGVSEQTKREILNYKMKLENSHVPDINIPHSGKMIKVITAIKNLKIAYDSEMDLWTDVLAVFEKEAKKRGYFLSISYIDISRESAEQVIHECNDESVAGIILEATELSPEEIEKFEMIQKPMVIYDNESATLGHNCVVADNYLGAKRAVRYLLQKNHKDIVYFSHGQDIYNFQQRRKGFQDALLEHNLNPYSKKNIIKMGNTIEEVYKTMWNFLDRNKLPEACIMENYQVSIGVMRALRQKNIHVPNEISLIGIDIVPEYITGDCQLTAVCIPHTERACLTMLLLDKEIEERSNIKSRILTDCPLVEGNSVKTMEKEMVHPYKI